MTERKPLTSVEDAHAYIEEYFVEEMEPDLWIDDSLNDTVGANIAIILDTVLEKGYYPIGFEQEDGYRIYRYSVEEPLGLEGEDNTAEEERESFIQAGAFGLEYEARSFMGKLESEGVECFIADNNITAVNPFMSNAVGGIKVNVKASDHEKVQEILAKMKELDAITRPTSKKIQVGGKYYNLTDDFCPQCEAQHVYTRAFELLKIVIGFLTALMFLPPPFKNQLLCRKCKHTWEK